jgi:hypothetical protein
MEFTECSHTSPSSRPVVRIKLLALLLFDVSYERSEAELAFSPPLQRWVNR